MLSIEEYIRKRKIEDKINEYDIDSKMDNMRICVNYVFEYFNQYLDYSKGDNQTALNFERLLKYKKQLSQYDPEIQDWLVSIYDDHDKQLNRSIISYLKKDEIFLIYSKDAEFRSASYECYAHLIKKNPYLKGQTEMLFHFIKDQHRIQSIPKNNQFLISEEITEWIEKTWENHRVNLQVFALDWVTRFYDNIELWPTKHRIKSSDDWRKYEYDIKQKNNLFNINSLYKKISNKSFFKGKKQYLEILMMYCWINDIDNENEDYWKEYLNKSLNR
jgi:hypothetical protein